MSRFIIPYAIRLQADGRLGTFPAAEILVKGRGGKGVRAIFQIDSGATITILPADDAKLLGIEVSSGDQLIIRGISGEEIVGYKHLLAIDIEGLNLKIPAVFILNPSVPRVLGREGFFSKFAIIFVEEKRKVALFDKLDKSRLLKAVFTQN
ncbi:hypothetical protein A2Z63_02070 [Candidatus Giovannonibacteria bacterium RIFCSPLOWO2_02_44_8]|uniref:Peptidase A2 domain-containing protein n=3 Tax=Candidatus Giovannoniibacteriota TaxID=1752738 RepID=A0A1F5XCJ5_9BACT|nr:MAG: hypothetical protein A2W57_01655 [Candidatus Giovannonibacteria bacterium RIFCSPHIGHO2_02_43_16]OGF85566.1 MAG: hypothetical protein A2Z63_02070 [Candidatus Giovannonibacteria bacterium RIFCSPLOWO2_02_44_8]OGF95760.1 MAG: hypothetical protein A2Y47_01250 [Candidatus Giovannonibacteria bacterium RIFCSPLOWO2_12_43_8]